VTHENLFALFRHHCRQHQCASDATFATWEAEAELDRELAALKEENAQK
jgi:hypothetical protein